MRKKLAIGIGILATFFICGGVAYATQTFSQAIRVPALIVDGISYLRGTIKNDKAGKPVTISDNLRIDGSISSRSKFNKKQAVKVDGGLKVTGNIAVSGKINGVDMNKVLTSNSEINASSIEFSNNATGLVASNMQEALDEVSAPLSKIISYNCPDDTELVSTYWRATMHSPSCANGAETCEWGSDPRIVGVTFVPTGEGIGTFTAASKIFFNTNIFYVDDADPDEIGYIGSYLVNGNHLMIKDYWGEGESFPGAIGGMFPNDIKGSDVVFTESDWNFIHFINHDGSSVTLTRAGTGIICD